MTATTIPLATVDAEQATAQRPASWTNSPKLVWLFGSPADMRGVTKKRTSPTTTTEPRSAVEGQVSSRYGLPLACYERARTIEDIQHFLNIGRTQA
jgi:hypothetical protein